MPLDSGMHELRANLEHEYAQARRRFSVRTQNGNEEGAREALEEMGALTDRLEQVDREGRRLDDVAAARNGLDHVILPKRDPTVWVRDRDGLSEGDRAFVAALRGERRVFPDFFEVNLSALMLDPETPEIRALDAGSGGGASLVPVEFLSQLAVYLTQDSRIRAAGARVIETADGRDLLVPKRTALPSVSGVTTEGGTISEADPTYAQGTLHAYKIAAIQQVSNELYEDSAIALISDLAQSTAEAISNAAGSLFVKGTGSSQPQGFLTSVGGTVTGGTAQGGTITASELMSLYYTLPVQYRKNASWFFTDTQLQAVRELQDTTNRYLLNMNEGLGDGSPGSLMGRPVFNDPYVPAAATSATSVAFGDFTRGYYIRETPLRFEISRDYAFNQDLVTLRSVLRTDGIVVDPNAFAVYVGGTA